MIEFKRSILLPIEFHIPYYESFVLQYSLVTSSNLVLRTLVEQSDNNTLHTYFNNMHGLIPDYKDIKMNYLGAGINYECPQVNESRGFILDTLFSEIFSKKDLCKETLEQVIIMKEFLLLYGTFEGCLKTHFLKTNILPKKKYLRENELFKYIELKLKTENNFDSFVTLLTERANIGNYRTLEIMWKFFTYIRHLYIHAAGKATKKWIDGFNSLKRELVNELYESFSNKLYLSIFIDKIDDINPLLDKIFFPTNELGNLFINLIITTMECLYLTENRDDSI